MLMLIDVTICIGLNGRSWRRLTRSAGWQDSTLTRQGGTDKRRKETVHGCEQLRAHRPQSGRRKAWQGPQAKRMPAELYAS